MERRVVFDFEYSDRYLKQCLTQCFVRAARSNVFQASLVFTTISVVIVYVCVRVFVIVFAFVRAGRHAAMASLFSPSCTILDIIVFLCVCVYLYLYLYLWEQQGTWQCLTSLFTTTSVTLNGHISPLSFLKLHCTLLSLIGHKKQLDRAEHSENKTNAKVLTMRGKYRFRRRRLAANRVWHCWGCGTLWHTVALVCTTTTQHALLCPCRRCICVFLICVLLYLGICVYFYHLTPVYPYLFSGISQHLHSLEAPLLWNLWFVRFGDIVCIFGMSAAL